MFKIILCISLLAVLAQGDVGKLRQVPQDPLRADLPTVYEHFTEGGLVSGLDPTAEGFMLNGKLFKIISGAMHYFRIHPDMWRDRLRKLRASGANTVETYVAWNLHEPERDVYDFGDGNHEMSAFLNVSRYLEIAKEEDLLVLFRPGPYICSEWDYGGLPSWLQQDPDMRVRQFYQPYLDRVQKYYTALLPQLVHHQFLNGGPIIGFQIENEYGSFSPKHTEYIQFVIDLVKDLGFDSTLLFTSDGVGNGYSGTLPDQLFMTANFQGNVAGNFDALLKLQPNKPVMAMEYWTGWFDHWFEDHNVVDVGAFASAVDQILGEKYNGSINFYMFHGGTNFGFMAGANSGGDIGYQPDITSYDYDALLTEAGDYAEKYHRAVDIINMYEFPQLSRPIMPEESAKFSQPDMTWVKLLSLVNKLDAYPTVTPTEYLTYEDILNQVPMSAKFLTQGPASMEDLPMNGGSGQSYGYLVHRKNIFVNSGAVLKAGPVEDFGYVIVDGVIQQSSFAGEGNGRYWVNSEKEVTLENFEEGWHNVDLFIENMARVNFGHDTDFLQKKGLPTGAITLNNEELNEFEVIALEFKSAWVKSLQNYRTVDDVGTLQAPLIVRSTFNISGIPADTFVDMNGWEKGIVFINGFNLGRYWNVGPQRTLYLPASFLLTGENTLIIFEQLKPGSQVTFSATPFLGKKKLVDISKSSPTLDFE